MTTPKLSLVVPMYQEVEGVDRLVAECLGAADRLLAAGRVAAVEVVLVDDGSTDGTAERVAEVDDRRVRLLRHDVNRGVGAAMRTGFSATSGDLVAYTDADLPVALDRLDDAIELQVRTGAAAVSAHRSRAHGDGLRRTLLSWLWNRAVRWAVGLDVPDVNFAFKLYVGDLLRDLHLESVGAAIDAEVLAAIADRGGAIELLAVDYQPRRTGRSQFGTWRSLSAAAADLRTVRRSRARR